MHAPQPFRVVHILPHLRGAPGRAVADIAIEQQRRWPGLVAIVLSQDLDEPWTTTPELVLECRDAGVMVFWCGEFFRRDVVLLPWAARAIREMVLGGGPWAADAVVHAHTAMAAVVGRKAGAPRVVLTQHGVGSNRTPEIELQDDIAYMVSDVVIVPTGRVAARLRETRELGHVSVVRPALHLTFPARPKTKPGRRLVYPGPLTGEHEPALLLDAMPFVWTRVVDAQLHLIGHGELAGALRAQALTLDPSGQRIVVSTDDAGPRTDTVAAFDVLVSASAAEQVADAVFVAMAAGLPVVARGGTALADVVEEARCGLIGTDGTARDLGLAMAVLLDTAETGRDELGAASRQFAATLGVRSHVAALEAVYGPIAWAERQVRWTAPDGPVRLHLGSGPDRRAGWLNVDTRAEAEPDLVARVHSLPMVPDAVVDEIEACHLFEHLSLHEATAALREWARVLKPGGRLFLELPNFDACVRLLGHASDALGYDFGMIGIYGWPPAIERDGDAMTHRWGWTPATLTTALEAAGFTGIELLPITQTYRPAAKYDRDFRIGAVRAAVPEGAS